MQLNIVKFSKFSATHQEWGASKALTKGWTQLYWIVDGDAIYQRGDKLWRLSKGNVYLIPGNCAFTFSCDQKIEKYYSLFKLQLESGFDLLDELGEPILLSHFSENDQLELAAIAQQKSKLSLYSSLMQLHLKLLTPVLEQVERLSLANQIRVQRHRNLLAYIDANLSATLQVSELARFCNQSVPALSRAFHRDFNMTLKAYLKKQLNKLACELLTNSGRSVASVAEELGFNKDYFFQFFKQMNNQTPRQYQKSLEF